VSRTVSLQIPASARGERLDQYLASALPELTRSRLKALIEEAHVSLEGKPAKAAQRLKGGEAVAVTIPEAAPATAQPQDLALSILFEDDDLVVLDKAAGMVVHPAAGNWDGTVVNALLFRVKGLTGVGGELRPGLVHRLDKETSGALVVAKTEQALRALQGSFKSREVEKVYLALVHGEPPASATIRTLHGRHPVHRKKFTGKVKEGKPAVTHYEVRERFEGAALLEVRLETGRTHQIRVHLAEAGFPLFGDALYGGLKRGKGLSREVSEALGRQALHAWKLAFTHPRTGKRLSLIAPVPADFQQALERLQPKRG
jgi:23S rRNA pseudouridine1911/1915/1917 synthase